MHRLDASKPLALFILAFACTAARESSAGIINITDAGQTNSRTGGVSDGPIGLGYLGIGSGSSDLPLGGSSASSSNFLETVATASMLSISTSTSASVSADEDGSGSASGTASQAFTFSVDADGTYRLTGSRGTSGGASGEDSSISEAVEFSLFDQTANQYLVRFTFSQNEDSGFGGAIGSVPSDVQLVAGNVYTLYASSSSGASAGASSSADGSAFANVTLAVIPEPSSLSLSGLAIAGMAGFAGRRRRAVIECVSPPRRESASRVAPAPGRGRMPRPRSH